VRLVTRAEDPTRDRDGTCENVEEKTGSKGAGKQRREAPDPARQVVRGDIRDPRARRPALYMNFQKECWGRSRGHVGMARPGQTPL
jgi:hypothetical protein